MSGQKSDLRGDVRSDVRGDLLFELPPSFTLPVTGDDRRYPVNRIFCVGRNYAAHATEMGNVVDRAAPFYFTVTPANARLGGEVAFPPGTEDYHHEVEFVVALKSPSGQSGGRNIPAAQAEAHIFGYGVGLDMTRRDLQAAAKDKRRPWCIAKDVEAGALFSPLTRREDFGAIGNQAITLRKNDALVQSSTIDLMVHSVPDLIAHLSQFYDLGAGDVIMTGTPEGVGPVARGDRLVGTVTGISPIDVTFV